MQTIDVDDYAHFKALYRDPVNGDWMNVVIEATWARPELGRDGSDVHGYIEVEGTEGSVRTHIDEEGRDCLRITSRVFRERLIPVKAVHQEEEYFQAEFINFAQSIRHRRPSILNAHIGEGVIRLLNSAQFSELRGRKAVTLKDTEAFSAVLSEGARDPWEAGIASRSSSTSPSGWAVQTMRRTFATLTWPAASDDADSR
jgi:predicted dehydrogenase